MATRAPIRPNPGATTGNARWHGIRSKVHAKLLQLLTPDQLRALNKDGVREQLGIHIERIVREENIPLTQAERDRLIEEVLDEVFGLGPLEILFKDPTISDIMVNGPDSIYVERNRHPLQGPGPPPDDHRSHRLQHRPPHR
jgi:pilus assembly protein CpaF